MYDPEDFVSYGPEYFRYYRFHKSFYRKTRYRYAKGPGYPLEQALERINTEIAAAVKPLESIDVAIDPTNGKRFVVFKSQGESFYPEEVSDGTMKWLCILVSIFVPDVRLYLLEEPESISHYRHEPDRILPGAGPSEFDIRSDSPPFRQEPGDPLDHSEIIPELSGWCFAPADSDLRRFSLP